MQRATGRQGRGIYLAWFSMDGYPVYYAVTADGELLRKVVVLRPGIDRDTALLRLAALLDRVDPPRPRLELVRDAATPPSPKQITLEQIDALYRDADPVARMLWRRKRASARGQLRSFQ